jgi:DNA-binding CsgD family transcriptional regulator
MREANLAAISPWLDFVVRACAALAAGHDPRPRCSRPRSACPTSGSGPSRWPGSGSPTASSSAGPWTARTAAELRVAGSSRDASAAVLTWQEDEIVELAVAGLTNKQVGEQLFLSDRTISTYLYRIFPKLGITSRAALRDALAAVSRPRRDDSLFRLECVVHGVPAADGATPRPGLGEGGIAQARAQDGENAVVVRGARHVGMQPSAALGLQHRGGRG